MKQHKKPCKECPWKKTSAPGYLGASNPVEFLQLSEQEAHMPCHLAVNYEKKDWREQVDAAPQCAGRAIHFANRCKISRSGAVMDAKPDDSVFAKPQDFIDHHSNGKGPKITIIGAAIFIDAEPTKPKPGH